MQNYLQTLSHKEQFKTIKQLMDNYSQSNHKNIQEYNQKFAQGKYINKGTYGQVETLNLKQKSENSQNTKLAVKKLDCREQKKQIQENEVEILQLIKILPEIYRKYIINIINTYYDEKEQKIYMVMPQAQKSFFEDIQDRIKDKNYYKPQQLYNLLSCALLALYTLQCLNIAHRDIKPQNMLIMDDNILVLSDFGTSQQINCKVINFVGTPQYFHPQQVEQYFQHQNKNLNEKVLISFKKLRQYDLYGIAQTFIQAASLEQFPYVDFSNDSLWYFNYNQIRDDYFKKAFQTLENLDKNKKYCKLFISLLKKILQEDIPLKECLNMMQNFPDW